MTATYPQVHAIRTALNVAGVDDAVITERVGGPHSGNLGLALEVDLGSGMSVFAVLGHPSGARWHIDVLGWRPDHGLNVEERVETWVGIDRAAEVIGRMVADRD